LNVSLGSTWISLQNILEWNGDEGDEVAMLFELWFDGMAIITEPSLPKWFLASRIIRDAANATNDEMAESVMTDIMVRYPKGVETVIRQSLDARQIIVNRLEKTVSCMCDRKIKFVGNEFTIRAIRANSPWRDAMYAQVISMDDDQVIMSVSMPMGQSASMFSHKYDNLNDVWRNGDFKEDTSNDHVTLIINKSE
jgi:hypothetical protein